MNGLERRTTPSGVEVRAKQDGKAVIAGYGAVFNRMSQNLGGFVEEIDPAAFTKTIQEADVRGMVNHDPNWVLGRTAAGSLRLTEDGTGLRYEIDVDLTDPDGQRAVAKVEAGLLDGSSFGFRVIDDDWSFTDQDVPLRRLLEVQLRDVGPATFPAYQDTTAEMAERAFGGLAEKTGRPVGELVAASGRGELRALLEPDNDDDGDEDGRREPEQHSTPSLTVARLRHGLMGRRHGRTPAVTTADEGV